MTTRNETILETTKASIGKEKYKMMIESNGHILIGDEPISSNGGDLGMNPFSLLLAGLSSCSASTVKMFADRKQWPLEGATVNVIMKRVGEGKGEIEIIKEVELKGDLSAEQRTKLLDIAAHCAVHQILTGPVTIHTVMSTKQVSV